jgi:hypothetical protein
MAPRGQVVSHALQEGTQVELAFALALFGCDDRPLELM